MRILEALQDDHVAIRGKLALLDDWLPLAQAAPFTIQQLTRLIARRLHAHTEKETFLLSAVHDLLREQAGAPALEVLAGHERERQAVAALIELLLRCQDASADELIACASNLIGALEAQLAHEEHRVFPVIERLLNDPSMAEVVASLEEALRQREREEGPSAPAAPPRATVTPEMSVEQVLRLHPRAQQIVRAFGIDPEADRACRLSGLEWRRGLDVDAVVLALNQALGARNPLKGLPEALWNACDGLLVIDERRRILAMNPTLAGWTGRSVETVAGQRECAALFACEDRHGCPLLERPEACPGLKAMRQRKPVPAADYTIATATGRRMPVSASYTPLQLHPGGPVWALAVMRDVGLRQRRERRMRRQAMRDPLTGLPNRASFLSACGKELARAARHHRPLAVAMADLDGLKAYNDRHGHLAGDALLKAVAGRLQVGLRATELVARYGGDEFVFLFPETDAGGAISVAERVRQAVAQVPCPAPQADGRAAPPGRVTVSLGIAAFPVDGDSVEALLRAADQRLYEAKAHRNRVVGPPFPAERRRHPRLTLAAPIHLGHPAGEWVQDGITKNVSLGGVYCFMPPLRSMGVDDPLSVALAIPPAQHHWLPCSRLAGQGRIVRVEALAGRAAGTPDPAWVGVAIAFADDVAILPAASGNGRPEPPSA